MKKFTYLFLLLLTSCGSLPELYQAAEDIADDDAIKISVSKEAMQNKKDVAVSVDIKTVAN